MEANTIKEHPIFSVDKLYPGDDLRIYAADLKAAEVGKEWRTEKQDRYPNATCTWYESYKVVYKDDNGVAVLYHYDEATGRDYYQNEHNELFWVELH